MLWTIALVITLVSAWYQRATGPTHPLSGEYTLRGASTHFELPRSHAGATDCSVSIPVCDSLVEGTVLWRLDPSTSDWTRENMRFRNGFLEGRLPVQPAAGHLEYVVVLRDADRSVTLPEGGTAKIRFKGDVPPAVLIPHIAAMFCAMLLSTRAGLESFREHPRLIGLTRWTIGFLLVGGMILGPIVQRYAFGAFWTGWPFGNDLTDNKTLIALIAWVLAAVALLKFRRPKFWVLAAAIILLSVYLIPHSLLGSRLDPVKTEMRDTTSTG